MSDLSPYERLSESLHATNVISPEFRAHIMSWALKIAEEAYKNGQEDARPKVAAEPITSQTEIERALRDARLDSTEVRIGYTDDAGHYTERVILPLSISSGRNVRVIARDIGKGEIRTFRVDRVEWLESV